MRAFELFSSEPWLITREGLEQMMAIAARVNDVDALQVRQTQRLDETVNVRERDGVAIVPVVGPIFRYANLFTMISGATSTGMLAKDIQAALDNPDIRAIVLEFNTPGGAVAGINELGNLIYDAREVKPIVAYGDHNVQSAGYWLASAASQIVVDRTSIIGSIGAVISVTDTSGRDQKLGLRTVDIVSSQSPDKRIDPHADEGRAKLQKIVDDLADVFVSTVARNRNTTVDEVLENYGRGGSMVGQAAVDAGLVDRIGSLESVIAELAPRAKPFLLRSFSMATPKKGPITVATTLELQTAAAAGHTIDEISIATVDVQKISAEAMKRATEELSGKHEAALATARAEAAKEATEKERARIAGLREICVKGFEKEIDAAIVAGDTVEATAIKLAKSSAQRGVSVPQLAGEAPKAVAHGGTGEGTGGESAAKAPGSKWSSIVARAKSKQAK
jgi:signal peptide peptidase SppA